MLGIRRSGAALALAALTLVATVSPAVVTAHDKGDRGDAGSGAFKFTPVAASAACTPGGNPAQPFVLPAGFTQTTFASEPQFPDLPDMNTLNETGPRAGRFLYRSHEVSGNGAVTVTDLKTGQTSMLAQRADWERLDGIVWTPWGTILTAEETNKSKLPDPQVPQATAGLVYEIDPATGAATVRPAIGSRSHEGLRFDTRGNLYGISERNPGFIYKFTPDRRGDLSSGQLYALKITKPDGDRTGEAVWLPLDRAAVQVNSDDAAAAAGATSYSRPEDVEIATSTGNNRGGVNVMYVALTGENRVIAVDLGNGHDDKNDYDSADDKDEVKDDNDDQSDHDTQGNSAYVYNYVVAGVNAPADFEMPDNLALDKQGNLFIAEDPGGKSPAKTKGDDIWVAMPGNGGHGMAQDTVRFASLTDCDAEPTGIYFDLSGKTLYVNVQHRGGDGRDLAVAITPTDK